MLIALTALGTVLARAGVIVFAVFRGSGTTAGQSCPAATS